MVSDEKQFFKLEIVLDEKGNFKTQTMRKGIPFEVIVGALSQQLFLYNKMWAEESSFTAK